jgi:hypothetical protein
MIIRVKNHQIPPTILRKKILIFIANMVIKNSRKFLSKAFVVTVLKKKKKKIIGLSFKLFYQYCFDLN